MMLQRIGIGSAFQFENTSIFQGNYCIEQRMMLDNYGNRRLIIDYSDVGAKVRMIDYNATTRAKAYNDLILNTEWRTIIDPTCRFTKPFYSGRGRVYLTGNDNQNAGGNTFLWGANDPNLTSGWSKINGGFAIMPSVAVAEMSNFTCLAVGDYLHAWIENPGGLYYSRSTVPELGTVNFQTLLTPHYVIPGAGNADAHLSPCGRYVILLHGYRHPNRFGGNYWFVTASVAKLSDDLSLAASYRTVFEGFIFGQDGYHICDPSVFDGEDDCVEMLMSYNQASTIRAIAPGFRTKSEFLNYLVGQSST